MAILIGLCVAASFGNGDFLGGIASRRSSTLSVLALAQITALAGALIVALAVGGGVTTGSLLFGAGAGLLNVTALGCLYRALAIGQIGQVAPVAAVIGAVLPIGWALAIGERPSALALVGVALAVVAGALITRERDERQASQARLALLLAVIAGVGFGTSFILFTESSHHSGFWPVLSARLAAVIGVSLVLVLSRTSRSIERSPRNLALGAGVLDVGATVLLLVAVRTGQIALVAPVASLAPGFTVVNAWWYLHEKASRTQLVGLILALLGLVLIAVG